MLTNMKLKGKFTIYFLTVGLIPLLIVAVVSYSIADHELEKKAFDQLYAIQIIKKNQIENYFNERKGDITVYSNNNEVVNAARNFITAFDSGGLYGEEYKEWESQYHNHFKMYNDTYGYYDVFLISPDGDVVYTVAKEADLGENLVTGTLSNSGLAKAYRGGLRDFAFVDYEWYDPSNEPGSFIAAPIRDEYNELVGVLAYQISLKQVNAIMQERSGMGETGETYLVGEDLKMRSDSYLDPEGHSVIASFAGTVEKNGVDTKATQEVFRGNNGQEIIIDYNSNPVLSVYSPLEIPGGVTWAIIAEIDEAEAFAATVFLRNLSIIIGLVLGLLVTLFAISIAQNISTNVAIVSEGMKNFSQNVMSRLTAAADSMAKGVLELNVQTKVEKINLNSTDEIGDLAADVNNVLDMSQETVNSIAKAINTVKEMVEETKKLVDSAVEGQLKERGNAERFEGGYKEVISGLNETLNAVVTPIEESGKVLEVMSSGDLTVRMKGNYKGDFEIIKNSINNLADSLMTAIQQVHQAVEATANAGNEISSSSEEMAAGAQEQSAQASEVASAVEEMTKTIMSTAGNAGKASEFSKHANDYAKQGNSKVQENKASIERIIGSAQHTGNIIASLAGKTDQIGEIAQVIDDIADQTNLLALNAAIEAARAGEQGRGFAVVADEVRKLAERTTKATKEIAETIKAIQNEAKEADESMVDAREAVMKGKQITDGVEDSLNSILDSTETVMSEINQVAAASEEQSTASEQISKNIEAISSVTHQSAASTQQIAKAAEDLNNLTINLQNLVAQFKVENNSQQTMMDANSNYLVKGNDNMLINN